MRWRRLRKWGKWSCTLATGAIWVLTVCSRWFDATWICSDGRASISLACGSIILDSNQDPVPARGFSFGGLDDPTYYLGYEYMATRSGSIRCWFLPLWPLLPVSAFATGILWRLDRRLRPHQCATCGYDRRGLERGAATPCPECGTVPAPAAK